MSYKELVHKLALAIADRKGVSQKDAFAIGVYELNSEEKQQIIRHNLTITSRFLLLFHPDKYSQAVVGCYEQLEKDVFRGIANLRKEAQPSNITYSQAKFVRG